MVLPDEMFEALEKAFTREFVAKSADEPVPEISDTSPEKPRHEPKETDEHW